MSSASSQREKLGTDQIASGVVERKLGSISSTSSSGARCSTGWMAKNTGAIQRSAPSARLALAMR